VIRLEAGMPTVRFTRLLGVPERSYRRWQQRQRQGRPVKGPWPAPAADRIEPTAIRPTIVMMRSRPSSRLQVDYLFVSDGLIANPNVCGTLDQEEWAECRDHAPIIATFEADSGSEG